LEPLHCPYIGNETLCVIRGMTPIHIKIEEAAEFIQTSAEELPIRNYKLTMTNPITMASPSRQDNRH
jgi:hypothetical protein